MQPAGRQARKKRRPTVISLPDPNVPQSSAAELQGSLSEVGTNIRTRNVISETRNTDSRNYKGFGGYCVETQDSNAAAVVTHWVPRDAVVAEKIIMKRPFRI